ncbi:glycosyltransferase [Ferrovibrio sp.]|uniref:glycosyltransferase n=1 Tax=Ferrovibrio sp. TaxID=1917215 RepID=UPI0035ADD0CA
MKKILIVINSLDRGGTERHLMQVLPRLSQCGYRVAVYCLVHKGELSADLERAGVTVFGGSVKPHSSWGWLFALGIGGFSLGLRLLLKRPDIVHFFLPSAYIIGAPLAWLTFIPIKIMSRRSLNNYQRSYFWLGQVERFLHRQMDVVTGNSMSVVTQLREEGVPEQKLRLIYNGVDMSGFIDLPARDVARSKRGIDPDVVVFVIVANLLRYKGHDDLLEAFAIAEPNLPDKWVLFCAGRDGGIGGRLTVQAQRLGLEDRIRFLGPVADIPQLLAAADIALLPSHEEGFSNAVIEYMAAGLPVIATDVGGNAEALNYGQAGIVVPARDPVALAAAISGLAVAPELRRSLGSAAKRRVAEHFSLEICLKGYGALYNQFSVGDD